MSIFKLMFAAVKGGKRNIALAALVIVYAAQKLFGVEITEAEVVEQISVVLGAVGLLHGAYKSDTVKKIIDGAKKKDAAK